MAYDSIALITNEAKRRIAEGWITGKSYKVSFFSVSSTGHDFTDPTVALAIDPAAIDIGPELFGPTAISGYEWTSDFCPIFVCRLEAGDVVGAVSAVGLWAETVCVPDGDPEPAGTRFLFAVHHGPLMVFTGTTSAEFPISVFM